MEFILQKIEVEGELLQQTKCLFNTYQQELNENLCFQNFDAEMQNPLLKYANPTGALFVATQNNIAIGCVALQKIDNSICEMKRLYVLPEFRKFKIGEKLVIQIIEIAKLLGYTTMKLDTLSRLHPAIKLYEKFGFIQTQAYYSNPLSSVVYMELSL